jgi:hypothetical protein
MSVCFGLVYVYADGVVNMTGFKPNSAVEKYFEKVGTRY